MSHRTAALTVVVPVFDESATVEGVVRDVVEVLARRGRADDRVLVLNDGSRDWSPALERRLLDAGPVEVRSFWPNRGKGAVLNRAFPLLSTELAAVIDADGEYAAADLPAVAAPLEAGEADWVLGSRYGFGRPRPRQYAPAWAVNRMVNAWFRVLSGVALCDLLSGLFAFRSELVAGVELREARFSYTAELAWRLLAHRGLRIREVPVGYRFRGYAEGKKIRWWETATILAALGRYGLAHRRGRLRVPEGRGAA